jgi:hypothetical protein
VGVNLGICPARIAQAKAHPRPNRRNDYVGAECFPFGFPVASWPSLVPLKQSCSDEGSLPSASLPGGLPREEPATRKLTPSDSV